MIICRMIKGWTSSNRLRFHPGSWFLVLISLFFCFTYNCSLVKSAAISNLRSPRSARIIYSYNIGDPYLLLSERKFYRFRLLSRRTNEGQDNQGSQTSLLSCISLIAGTTIGGGFLALPAVTAPVGAFPACACLFACWAYLTGCALSLSSAIFRLSDEGNRNSCHYLNQIEDYNKTSDGVNLGANTEFSIFRVAKRTFGNTAGAVAAGLYVVLMLSTLVAQLSKIGNISASWSSSSASRLLGIAIFSGLMYAIAFMQDDLLVTERVNSLLTAMMMGSFSAIISAAPFSGMDLRRWQRADFAPLLLSRSSSVSGQPWAVPVFLQLLVYTEVVPLVCARLRDEKKVRQAIVLGSVIPLLMCVVWTLVAIGLTPVTTAAVLMMDDPIDSMMRSIQQLTVGAASSSSLLRFAPIVLSNSVTAFALSAISTTVIGSLLTVSQFLVDIMSEFMVVKPSMTAASSSVVHQRLPDKRKIVIARMISILCPATIVAVGSKSLYYAATAFAGAFPVTLLWGLLPTAANLKLRRRPRTDLSSTVDILLCIVSILMLITNVKLMFP